jgi:hypothetical protein
MLALVSGHRVQPRFYMIQWRGIGAGIQSRFYIWRVCRHGSEANIARWEVNRVHSEEVLYGGFTAVRLYDRTNASIIKKGCT